VKKSESAVSYHPVVRRTLLVVVLLLAAAPAAHGATYAKVVSPSGRTVALASGTDFSYPADGSLLKVTGAQQTSNDVLLSDVQLLDGQVDLSQVDLLASGKVLFGPLVANGRVVTVAPNTLVPLGSAGYAVVDQTAKIGAHTGRVALRVVLNDVPGVAKGTELLVALSLAQPARQLASNTPFDPLAVLGFSASVSGAVGFVAAPSIDGGPIGERAVAIAEQFLGVQYTWGGASPLTGFDCSGLAMYVYGQLGVSLTHYTGAQILEGMPVDRTELAPGDLVFFEPNAQDVPQHEGIYVGDDKFIQAPHTGDVVRISSLDDPQYALSYVGATRPYVKS
jgi:cell wall-associated NlpC family hydrolase